MKLKMPVLTCLVRGGGAQPHHPSGGSHGDRRAGRRKLAVEVG